MRDEILFIAPRPAADGRNAFEYVVTFKSGRVDYLKCDGDKLLADMATLQAAAGEAFGKRNDG